MKEARLRGADLLVRTLSALGVGRIFTLSGNQIMPVFDAALDAGTDLIHFRHEAAAVHAADAWGRLTGEPGVALVTAGPGFANTLTALYVAMAAESPVVLLSGHAPLSDLGRGGFQEMPQADMAGHVAKASWTAGSPERIGQDVARAFSIARSGRPGPVHIALPFDVLEASLPDDEGPPVGEAMAIDTGPPTESDVDGILDALRSARRPIVLPGQAISRTGGDALRELSDRTGLPVVGMESPRGINDPSLGAFAETLAEADLLVLLGKRLDYGLKFGESPALDPDCRIVHVDHEPAALEQTQPSPRRLRQAGGRRSCRSGLDGCGAGVCRDSERRRRLAGGGTVGPLLRASGLGVPRVAGRRPAASGGGLPGRPGPSRRWRPCLRAGRR